MSADLSDWLSFGMLAIAFLFGTVAVLPPWSGATAERRGVIVGCASALALLSSLLGDIGPNPDALGGAHLRIGFVALILVLIAYRQLRASRREITSAPRTEPLA